MANTLDSQFSIISYNMHGYNQGSTLLELLCDCNVSSIDCCFLQEHWLTPKNIYKLQNFSSDFSFFGISAMEQVVATSVLRGRPFGGVGIMLKNKFCKKVTFHIEKDRYVVVGFKDIILISVYFPKIVSRDDELIVEIMLAEIESIVSSYPHCEIICGGDYNNDLRINSDILFLFRKFITDMNFTVCSNNVCVDSSSINYTYCHDSLQHFSYIDFFLISSGLCNKIINLSIIENAINLSDHNPVRIICSNLSISDTVNNRDADRPGEQASSHTQKVHRWDHADLRQYYEQTLLLFEPILNEVKALFNLICVNYRNDNNNDSISSSTVNFCDVIDNVYSEIVSSLYLASESTVPKRTENYYKFWWTEEADLLKQNSIKSHHLWVSNGRPRSGLIFDEKV